MKRKIPLVDGQIYHILTRSIAGYEIFNDQDDFLRMLQLFKYYQKEKYQKFSDFIISNGVITKGFNNYLEIVDKDKTELIQIIAYCLMPTHIHLILKQLQDNGISKYIGNILNSYTRYFNIKHKRKGPLWEAKFKNILVEGDEQLLHLTRYVHLNPVTAKIIDKPQKWIFSSYREYLDQIKEGRMCDYEDILDIKPKIYSNFVNNRISYQRELAKIKTMIFD